MHLTLRKGLLVSTLMSLLFLAPHFSIAVSSSSNEYIYCSFGVMGNKGGAEGIIDDLLAEREGFGRNATGGSDGDFYYVTSLADSGAGSLRAAAESTDPLWIVFNVSGTIHLNSLLQVKSDKTFDGRGANVVITGYGFNLRGVSNIIINHLVFDTAGGDNRDGIRIYDGAHDIWVHHCDFTRWTDGCLDITVGSTDVTVSWCKFYDHDKTMLIGASPSDTGDVVIRVTLHHNYFYKTNQRHPRLRFGKVDAYNNYLYDWGIYGMGVAMNGSLLVEANIFEAGDDKDAVITSVGSDPYSGYSKLVYNLLLNGAIADENGPEQVFDRSTYYNATIETADNALKERIVAGAGALPKGPVASFTFSPANPIPGENVAFDASDSQSGWNCTVYVPIANYTWDFGDGNVTTVDAPTATVTHVYNSTGTFMVNLTVTCMDDPTLIAEGLTANSTWKNLTVTVTVTRLVVRTLWTNMSAMVGAGASVSNATYTVSDTTNSSGLTAFSLTKGLYNLTVSYSEVTINETTGLNLAQDMNVTITTEPAPYERIVTLLDTVSNLQSNITDLQSQVSSLQNQARNNLYIGIGGGSIIGLFIGVAAVLFLRKKR